MLNAFYIVVVLLLLNLWSYALMAHDKRKAKKGLYRTPERHLLLAAALFGSIGVWLAQFPPIRHKSTKPAFAFGVPLMLVAQIFISIWIYDFLQNTLGFYWKPPFLGE